jgi:cation:H+ antiporter
VTDGVAVQVVALVAGVAGLWIGGGWLVGSAVRTAGRLGVSDLVIGVTVVALGTSAAELAVSVDAALAGQSDIAVGNVVGSNLFNMGFILGGLAIAGGIPASRTLVRRDGTVLLASVLAVIAMLWDLRLGRTEGGLLVGALVVYLAYLLYTGQPLEQTDRKPFRRTDPLRLVAGLGLVLVGATLLVESASSLARLAGLSEWVIGVTVVAAGTSSPEVAASVAAARRGAYGVSAGNLVGSDLFNTLLVLGTAALVRPLSVDPTARVSLLSVLALVAVAVVLLWTDRELSRPEGALLVGIALVRWGMDLL